MAPDAHFDADDDVAVGVDDLDRLTGGQQPDIVAFADHDVRGERIDAGEGDMQVDEDARCARLDDMLAKSRKIARPGAAGIDAGR